MLGFGASEWRALPWWQRRLYTNGMTDELARGDLYRRPEHERGKERTEHVGLASDADYAALGIPTTLV